MLCGGRGWSVGINYLRDQVAAESTAREVRAAGGLAVLLQGDAAAESDVMSMFDSMAASLGKVDAVVINAGIVAPVSLLADMTSDRLKRMFDVNVYGAYLCARECARRLFR